MGHSFIPRGSAKLVDDCDELIDVTGRAAIGAVLQLPASHAAGGPAQQGKRRVGDVVFDGRQAGHAVLSDGKLKVERPSAAWTATRIQAFWGCS